MASTQVSRQPSEVDGSNVPALSGTVSLNNSLHAKGSLGGGSSLASKIAAFSNGVAPVKSGLVLDAHDDELLIEEVMHKLEAAARMPSTSGRCELSLSIVRAAAVHLNRAREEVARTEKELHEIRSSRVQLLPPSAWIKREHKYQMDLEKYEHTITMQAARLKEVEEQVAVLLAGDNIKPLEERIAELESQLKVTSEERTQYEGKFHELSIKHRQLIETSPQVATLWQEVVGASSAAQAGQHEVDRLTKFDLRHTAAGKGPGGSASLSMRVAAIKEAASRTHSRSASAAGLDGLAAASSPSAASVASNGGPGTPHSTSSATQQQQALAPGSPSEATHAEAAHMCSVDLQGLTPDASIAALQQLNYDLTMQLDLYQTMVTRLKDQMEAVDTEKADLEADKLHLSQQLATLVGGVRTGEGAAGSRGFGSWWRGRSRRSAATAAGGEGQPEAGEEGDWDRSTVAGDDTMSVAESLRSTLSGDLDGHPTPRGEASATAAGATDSNSTSTSNAADPSSSSDSQEAATASSAPQPAVAVGAVGTMAAAAGRLVGRLSRGQSASSTGGAAAGSVSPEVLSRQLREAKYQAQAVAEDNKVLVSKLVESQMELADAQGSVMQYKRALVRAMDKEVELDTKVRELQNILDMLTSSPRSADTARARAGLSEPGVLAQLAATLSGRLAAVVEADGASAEVQGDSAEKAAAEAVVQADAEPQAAAAAAAAAAGVDASTASESAAAAGAGHESSSAQTAPAQVAAPDGLGQAGPEEAATAVALAAGLGTAGDVPVAASSSEETAAASPAAAVATASGAAAAAAAEAATGAAGADGTPGAARDPGTDNANPSTAAAGEASAQGGEELHTVAVSSHAVADDATSDGTESGGEVMAELRPAPAVGKALDQEGQQ